MIKNHTVDAPFVPNTVKKVLRIMEISKLRVAVYVGKQNGSLK